MNEDRLVTLILWVVLLLGAVSLVAVYYTTSDRRDVEPPPSFTNLTETELSATSAREPLPPTVNLTETESSDTSAKEYPSFPVPASRDTGTLLVDRSTEETTTTTLPPGPIQVTIYETSKSNGAFYTAQDITEGVIIGKRGTASDRADYYKVRATGSTMILSLEPSLKERTHRFVMTVFDKDQRSIGEDLGKNGPPITVSVTPQAPYCIKIGLSNAPIETPQYQLHVRFSTP